MTNATLRGLSLAALFAASFPLAAQTQNKVFDLTPAFVEQGADIDQLLVYRVGGIVLIRGTTGDAAKSANAARIATFLGYDRVANLIRVVDEPSVDASIVARAHHDLDLEPMLQGCKFHVVLSRGALIVSGHVQNESQKSLAIEILSRVPGVKQIQWH